MTTINTSSFAISINIFGSNDFYLFTEDEFEKLRLSSSTVLVDFMPKVIAIGGMITTIKQNRQSPARTYGLCLSLFSAIFNLSSFVNLFLGCLSP